MQKAPVLLIIFNRPTKVKSVIEAISLYQPDKLYIAADGPREAYPEDIEKCKEARKIALEGVTWDCKVTTRFMDKNLGCGHNPAQAITWFFEHEQEGIILEDDVIPSLSFFTFCAELLKKYKYDNQIYVIGGLNFQNKKRGRASYYFSTYGHVSAMATWKRAWDKFDYYLESVDPATYYNRLKKYFPNTTQRDYWFKIFMTYKTKPVSDIWDFQWSVTQWNNNAINIVPNVNLVKNIGYDIEGTHTKHGIAGVSNMPLHEINKIKHPLFKRINRKADDYTFNKIFHNSNKSKKKESFSNRIKHQLKLFLSTIKILPLFFPEKEKELQQIKSDGEQNIFK